MARELKATRPKIYNGGGSMKRQWYIHYTFKNPWNGRMERFKHSDGINVFKTVTARTGAAKNAQAKLWRKLKAGYNPFDDPDSLYTAPQQKIIFNKHSISEILLETIPKITSTNIDKTVGTYKNYVANFCHWLKLKHKIDYDISLITEDDANNFLNHLSDAKGYTAKHRNEHLSLFKRIFNYIKRRKVIHDNPFEYCLNKKVVSKGRKFYRDGIRHILLDEMQRTDPQLLLYCEMIYYTLARPKEMRFLQIKQIHLTDARIEIPSDKSKTGVPKWITIPTPLLRKLLSLGLNDYPKEFYLFGKLGFPASGATSENFFRRRYKKLKTKFSLGRDYGVYNWKHTGAVKADRANIPHKDIQQQGGWTSLAMLDVYMKDMDTIDSPQIRNNYPDIRSVTGSGGTV